MKCHHHYRSLLQSICLPSIWIVIITIIIITSITTTTTTMRMMVMADDVNNNNNRLMFIDEPVSQLTQADGSRVIFKCTVSPPEAKIKWLRQGSIIDNDQFEWIKTHHNKLVVKLNKSLATNLSASGEEVYQCLAELNGEVIVSQPAKLLVAELQPFEPHQQDIVVNVIAGNTAVLPCDMPQGLPFVITEFEHDNRTISLSHDQYRLVPSGSLQILNTRTSDSGTYRCIAHNPFLQEKRYADFVINLQVHKNKHAPSQLRALHFVTKPKEVTKCVLGQNITIECVANGHPVPKVQWHRIDGELPKHRSHIEGSNLQITMLEKGDEGKYVCTATQSGHPKSSSSSTTTTTNQQQSTITTTTTIEVTEMPQIINDQYETFVVDEGQTLALHCDASGHPKPFITWLHNGYMLEPKDFTTNNIMLSGDERTLTIVHANAKQHNGMFQCFATNQLSSVYSIKSVHVRTLAEVMLYQQQQQQHNGSNGGNGNHHHHRHNNNNNNNDDDNDRNRNHHHHHKSNGMMHGSTPITTTSLDGEDGDFSDDGGGGGGGNGDDSWREKESIDEQQDPHQHKSNHNNHNNHHRKHNQHRKRPSSSSSSSSHKRKQSTNMIPPSKPVVSRLTDDSVMVRWSINVPNSGNNCRTTSGTATSAASTSSSSTSSSSSSSSKLSSSQSSPVSCSPIQFFKIQYREVGNKQNWNTVDEDIPPHVYTFAVEGLNNSVTYRFRIAAVYKNDDNVISVISNKFTFPKDSSKRPSNTPTIRKFEVQSSTKIMLEWQFLNVQDVPVDGFFIYYQAADSAGQPVKVTAMGADTRSIVIDHLSPGVLYEFRMQCFNFAGTSDFSNRMQVKTLPDTSSSSSSNNGGSGSGTDDSSRKSSSPDGSSSSSSNGDDDLLDLNGHHNHHGSGDGDDGGGLGGGGGGGMKSDDDNGIDVGNSVVGVLSNGITSFNLDSNQTFVAILVVIVILFLAIMICLAMCVCTRKNPQQSSTPKVVKKGVGVGGGTSTLSSSSSSVLSSTGGGSKSNTNTMMHSDFYLNHNGIHHPYEHNHHHHHHRNGSVGRISNGNAAAAVAIAAAAAAARVNSLSRNSLYNNKQSSSSPGEQQQQQQMDELSSSTLNIIPNNSKPPSSGATNGRIPNHNYQHNPLNEMSSLNRKNSFRNSLSSSTHHLFHSTLNNGGGGGGKQQQQQSGGGGAGGFDLPINTEHGSISSHNSHINQNNNNNGSTAATATIDRKRMMKTCVDAAANYFDNNYPRASSTHSTSFTRLNGTLERKRRISRTDLNTLDRTYNGRGNNNHQHQSTHDIHRQSNGGTTMMMMNGIGGGGGGGTSSSYSYMTSSSSPSSSTTTTTTQHHHSNHNHHHSHHHHHPQSHAPIVIMQSSC